MLPREVSMKVVVRLRPPNERELSSGKCNLIKVVGKDQLTFDPKEESEPKQQRLHTGMWTRGE